MEEYNEDNKHNRLKKYASVASVSVAVILAVTKIIASLMSGSLAVLRITSYNVCYTKLLRSGFQLS